MSLNLETEFMYLYEHNPFLIFIFLFVNIISKIQIFFCLHILLSKSTLSNSDLY